MKVYPVLFGVMSLLAMSAWGNEWREPNTNKTWSNVLLATDTLESAKRNCEIEGKKLPTVEDLARAKSHGIFKNFINISDLTVNPPFVEANVTSDDEDYMYAAKYQANTFWTKSTEIVFELQPVLISPLSYPKFESLPKVVIVEKDGSLNVKKFRRNWAVINFYRMESGPKQFNVICVK
jgi:hypothetical protein